MIALENDSKFSFAVANLGCVSGGRINEDMFLCYALRDLYTGQILLVDKY